MKTTRWASFWILGAVAVPIALAAGFGMAAGPAKADDTAQGVDAAPVGGETPVTDGADAAGTTQKKASSTQKKASSTEKKASSTEKNAGATEKKKAAADGDGAGSPVQKSLVQEAPVQEAQEGGAGAPKPKTAPVYALPEVEIIGTSPIQGTGITKDKIPVNVQTLSRKELEESDPLTLSDLLNSRMGSVTVNEVQNNPFQPDIRFRGFTASPLLGEPQGIAVYQNGVRVNEPFGDVVQWDLIPQFALESVQVIPGSNPVYGLNALGGALALQMKNGFNFQGSKAEAYGGSFGRYQVTGEYGAQVGNYGVYLGVTGFQEDGWRDHSPSSLQQVYGDARYRGENAEASLNFIYANTDLTGNSVAPVELLARNRQEVFTYPDITKNELFMLSAQGDWAPTDTVSFQGNAYYRRLFRNTLNGDAAEFEDCTGIGGPAGTLCENAGTADETQITDLQGNPIPTTVGGDGALNTTGTNSTVFGASGQTTIEKDLAGLQNYLVVGTSIDYGVVEFNNQSQVGALTPDRTITGSGLFVSGDEFNTRLNTKNMYIGVFFSNTLSVTDNLSVTLAGRYNYAQITLDDRLGVALNGRHRFVRFNPALGLTYKLASNVTAYANYGEANRAPSAVELSCADPTQPCRVPNAFLADPPLDQVVSRSVEIGARGRVTAFGGKVPINWSVAGFGSRNFDDIIFVSAGPVLGSGFFQNAGITQRAGAEIGLDGKVGPVGWYANYSFTQATFESNLKIASPNNPRAVNGEIQVRPGDRLPGVPQHTAKLGVRVNFTKDWTVGVESIINSSQFLRGDEANLLDPIGGYAVVNLNSQYSITDVLKVFVKVNNLFDRNYETFGLLGDPSEALPGFSNPRFLAPAAPLGVWAGLRLTL